MLGGLLSRQAEEEERQRQQQQQREAAATVSATTTASPSPGPSYQSTDREEEDRTYDYDDDDDADPDDDDDDFVYLMAATVFCALSNGTARNRPSILLSSLHQPVCQPICFTVTVPSLLDKIMFGVELSTD